MSVRAFTYIYSVLTPTHMASSEHRPIPAAGPSGVQPPRTAITRGERACEECRRMKVRCMREGSDRCHRCQHLNHECIMTPRARRGHGHSNARAKLTRSTSPVSRAASVSGSVPDMQVSFRGSSNGGGGGGAREYNSLPGGTVAEGQKDRVWPASSERRSSPSLSHSG